MFLYRNLMVCLMVLSTLSLMSCGHEKSSQSSKEINTVCEEMDCLSKVNWKILLQGKSFPAKSRIMINNETVINECFFKQKYSIDRSTNPESIVLENFQMPTKDRVSFSIYDMGEDCSQNIEFLVSDDIPFETSKTTSGIEVLINL
jgi:hypothetical protein